MFIAYLMITPTSPSRMLANLKTAEKYITFFFAFFAPFAAKNIFYKSLQINRYTTRRQLTE